MSFFIINQGLNEHCAIVSEVIFIFDKRIDDLKRKANDVLITIDFHKKNI